MKKITVRLSREHILTLSHLMFENCRQTEPIENFFQLTIYSSLNKICVQFIKKTLSDKMNFKVKFDLIECAAIFYLNGMVENFLLMEVAGMIDKQLNDKEKKIISNVS